MKKTRIRMIAFFFAIIVLASSLCVTPLALEWDGSTGGGTGNGRPADVRGFAVRYYPEDNCIGYRFSVVDNAGNMKGNTVIDVFRNTGYGNAEYTNAYKFTTKYNKKQLILYQNAGFSTTKNKVNCYLEAEMDFATALGDPGTMKVWQANNHNLNVVLSALGIGSVGNLKYGDKVLVEPLYDVMIEGAYHAVTTTELALYGKYYLGEDSNGGASTKASSWGFIAVCSNKLYPNLLYTPDGQGLWESATELKDKATFKTIINVGYGVGIAYTESKADFSPTLTVEKCDAWSGTRGVRNGNRYGFSKGNSFSTWTYENGYPMSGKTIWYSLYFPPETENCYVKQTVTVVGGSSTSRIGYSDANTLYDVSLSPTVLPSTKSYIQIRARVDWIKPDGTILKYGVEKSFYIPIRPTIYREQVSVINESGEVQAFSGRSGSEGCVYVGQKIYTTYRYTSNNSWGSFNHLSASLYHWEDAKWVMTDSEKDVDVKNALLSSTQPQTKNGTKGFIRVPDNSGSGTNVMRFRLSSAWSSDEAHTQESSLYTIPIVKADVELSDIYLVDEEDHRLDPKNLQPGTTVYLRHVYRNNTETKVFVEGFKPDRSQIPGIYSIPANGSITVSAGEFKVPGETSFTIWAGVYLEGAGIGHTEMETNGENNSWSLLCGAGNPLTIVPIVPNAPYRESTEVITAFRVYNGSTFDYTPVDHLTAKVTITKSDGSMLYTESKEVIVPAGDSNLVYWKWRIPEGLNGSSVLVKADLYVNDLPVDHVSNYRSTIPYAYYHTPETKYEDRSPDGFTLPEKPSCVGAIATWEEYKFENGSFVKQILGIGLLAKSDVSATPENGNSAFKDRDGRWIMKSGYGIGVESRDAFQPVGHYILPAEDAYTGVQYVYAAFPEFGYRYGKDLCTTLSSEHGAWSFGSKPGFDSKENYHYTPLYYPDGEYIIKIVKSDVWTPAGMMQSADTTESILISGSAYDDWYIGR